MNKLASQLLDKAQEFIEENPGLVTGLAASGGLGALGGAVFTDTEEDDSAGEKFKKRLKNALIAGGLASAAFGAGSYGISKLHNALPEDDESPLSAAVHSTPVRALGGGVGLAAGLGMQHKNQLDALSQVFPDSPMTKARLIEILNNPSADTAAMNAINKAWGGTDTASFRKWLENTGVDVAKLNDKSLSGIDKTIDSIGDFLSKNKLASGTADKLKLTPEKLAKWFHKAKANKYLLGATGLGLALPEIASATGNAVSSLFGGSLYE